MYIYLIYFNFHIYIKKKKTSHDNTYLIVLHTHVGFPCFTGIFHRKMIFILYKHYILSSNPKHNPHIDNFLHYYISINKNPHKFTLHTYTFRTENQNIEIQMSFVSSNISVSVCPEGKVPLHSSAIKTTT